MPNVQSLDRESLLDYFDLIDARAGEERSLLNPLFKGRNSELDQLHANVRRALRGSLANRTAIVHGAPGSGKSELMYQFMHQQREMYDDEVVLVKGSLPALRSTPRLMQLLLQSLPSNEPTTNAMSRLRGELSRMQAISAFGLSATRQERKTPEPMRSLDDHLVWLHGYLDELLPIVKERVFVFCVDEFQNLEDPESSLCAALNSVELGLRIVPVYFGLSDAPTVLAHAKVSRLSNSNSIAIGALDEESATRLIHEFCEILRVEFNTRLDRDVVAAETASACDGWPHHLASWMRAACLILPNYGYSMTNDVRHEIDHQCNLHRKQYYNGLVSRARFLRGSVYQREFGSLLSDKESVDLLNIRSAMAPIFEQVGEDFNIREFVNDAIHVGVLVERYDGDYEVPIPSLVNYLRDPDSI